MNIEQKASKGSVGVESFQGRLRLRLPRQLYEGKQKYLTLRMADTLENWKLAEVKAKQIEKDITYEQFDYTLARYKSQSHLTLIKPTLKSQEESTLNDLWDIYTVYKAKTLSVTTINKDFKKTKNHIASLPTQKLSDAVIIRNFLLNKLTPNAAKRVLTQLKACCDWAIDSKLITDNPFVDMAQKVTAAVKDEEDTINTFNRIEEEQIIAAFRQNRYYSHYTNYVKFLFMTGCRTSEAIGLTWGHINTNLTLITFSEAVVEGHRKDTKTKRSRKFPINNSLRELLLSIKPKDYHPELPVFKSPKGGLIDAHNFLNRAWKTILSELDIPYRPQYNTRHTFITNCLEAGVSVVQVAKWVGNSPEIIMKHYAGTIRQVQVPEFKD
ncbi:tyrosine-type recombinase/integrase [Iningainema tapete]|uniref:Tyrosine-type recombinase/integrase n=1 Tax=Iningainema tapete BLCC-T55 TaxID=2748662 RepID=A0A8J6XJU0_9CYAN|nr:tyrosine-type recombinase/integrase [Iningainema tapete]MBD2771667.1 tyrosine-type recombinase/integrase [Iningainema tapete BLCC-T55]